MDETKKERQSQFPTTIEQVSWKTGIVSNDRKQRMPVPSALIESLFRHGQVDDSFSLSSSRKVRKVSGWVEKDDDRFQDNYQTRPSSSELGSRSKRVSKWRGKRESFVDTAKCIPLLERGPGKSSLFKWPPLRFALCYELSAIR